MLETIIVVLILLWALGFLGGVAMPLVSGNAIHVLLVIVLVLIVIRILQGRSVLP